MRCIELAFELVLKVLGWVFVAAHWVATGFATVFVTTLLVTSIFPDAIPPTDPHPLPLPLMLALGSVIFTGLAVLCWRFPNCNHNAATGPIPEARLAEIESWLQRRISVEEAHETIRNDCPDDPEMLAGFNSWYADNFRPTDELWYYDTPASRWEQMWGENGFALIRNGKVLEFMMWSMN